LAEGAQKPQLIGCRLRLDAAYWSKSPKPASSYRIVAVAGRRSRKVHRSAHGPRCDCAIQYSPRQFGFVSFLHVPRGQVGRSV